MVTEEMVGTKIQSIKKLARYTTKKVGTWKGMMQGGFFNMRNIIIPKLTNE
jgi:hypothetical protein